MVSYIRTLQSSLYIFGKGELCENRGVDQGRGDIKGEEEKEKRRLTEGIERPHEAPGWRLVVIVMGFLVVAVHVHLVAVILFEPR